MLYLHTHYTNFMLSVPNNPQQTEYKKFYRFLPVLTEEQIVKLRDIAIGVKRISAFSDEEIVELERQLNTDFRSDMRPALAGR